MRRRPLKDRLAFESLASKRGRPVVSAVDESDQMIGYEAAWPPSVWGGPGEVVRAPASRGSRTSLRGLWVMLAARVKSGIAALRQAK